MKVFEIVSFWPGEIFVQRHLESFDETSFQPKLYSLGGDYSIPTSSIQPTNQRANLLPRFDGLNHWEKLKAIAFLRHSPNLLLDKRSWQNKLLLEFFNKENPDLIHFHWANTASRLAWLPIELQIPYTFSMRGHDITELTFDPKYIDRLAQAIRFSSGVHSVSEDIWRKAVRLCDIDETAVFHQTIYTTVPIPPIRTKKIRQSNMDSYTFVAVGRLDWAKNHIGLLIAFKRLLAEGLDGKLIIVGDGEERTRRSLAFWARYLEIEKVVSFLGTLSYSELSDLYRRSDAYIQSSISEGFSNALAEAMAFGLPIFATRVGGTQEIIKDGINGYLLDVVHPENWWEKLIYVQDLQKMQTISTQAWQDARKNFNAKYHAEQFTDFYCKSMGLKS